MTKAGTTKSHDRTGRRRRMFPTSTGKRVTPQVRDILWFQKLHEHGPLSSDYLHAFSRHIRRNEKRAKERLTDLFNEGNTPQGGPYLSRPQQQFQTIDARYKPLVYDLTPASEAVLQTEGLWRTHVARPSGPWWHKYMTSCITASIEIGTMDRDDLGYIHGWQVLERADTTLRYPTTFEDPNTGNQITKDLIPDALFGLEYRGTDTKGYRFFVVEADRGTEPATSKNINRKSHLRTFLQYEDYIGNGRYREHLGLTAPLLALFCTTSPQTMTFVLKTAEPCRGAVRPHLLFSIMDTLGHSAEMKPHSLLARRWKRAGLQDACLTVSE